MLRITGTGSALPETIVDNEALTGFLDTSDEWIRTRTGILQRHVTGDETLEELAIASARRAIENAGISPEQIDMILCSSALHTYVTPGLSCIVQGAVGAPSCPCMDINAACAGFLYALDVAQAYFMAGKAETILIVCAEETSCMVDWTDRATCVLFGDGAGSVIVQKGGQMGPVKMSTRCAPEFLQARLAPGNSPYKKNKLEPMPLYMNGQEVYKFAVSSSTADLRDVMAKAELTADDVRYFLLHQANMRILEAVRTRLKQPPEKFPHCIERCGNTSSASIPIILDELNRAGKIDDGDWLAMSAFGAGLTNAACMLRWG